MSTPARPAPATVAELLDLLLREPGRPRITWYGTAHERIELSGAVLANWVSKTTNLLVEEFDAAPGTRVLLDLPPHWRTLVWALGAWRAGACVTPTVGAPLDAGAPDVAVTWRPGDHPGVEVVAVTLPALARRFDGALPSGAVDAAAAVMTYGDVVAWAPPTDPSAPALPGLAHADLFSAARAADPAARVLRRATAEPVTAATLEEWLGVLAADGSVVLVHQDAEVDLDRVANDEKVTPGA